MPSHEVASRLAVVVGLGIVAACSSSSPSAPPPASAAAGPVARFKLGAGDAAPSYLDVPFPSDAYLTAAGKIVDPLPGIGAVVPNGQSFVTSGLAANNGFSRIGLASFVVDDPTATEKLSDGNAYAKIDRATLPVGEGDCLTATSSVYVVDLAPADPAHPFVPCRAGFHDDTPRSLTPPAIAVGPARGVLLEEGHEYAVVITSRVKDEQGRPLAASADMKAVAAGNAPGAMGALYNKAYATAAPLVQPMLADGASIVAIAPYKTMAMAHELFALRDALESAPVPPLAWDAASMAPMGATKFAAPVNGKLPAGFTASLDDWLGVPTAPKLSTGIDDPSVDLPVRGHDKIGAVGTAVFQATSFLQEKPEGYPDEAHHVFAYDASGNVVAQAPVKIWVSFAVPSSPMPAGGYPLVVLQHGLSGSRLYLLDLANVLAAKGWMVAAIDSVTFGARAPEKQFQVDQISVWNGAPGAKYQGPDGLADPVNQAGQPDVANGATNGSFDFFGGLQNLLAVRDQFRQAAYDTAQLVKLLRAAPDLSPLDTGAGAPKIDRDHVVYVGDSLGAMEGTMAAAIEPNLKAWMLNVDGGGLFPELAMHSPTIGLQVAAAASLNFDLQGDRLDVYHPFTSVLQDIVEAGDPITYAPYLVKSPQVIAGQPSKPRNVLQVQAVYDEVVANEANEAIARAGGWGMATPNVGSNAEVNDVAKVDENPRKTPFTMVDPDAAGAIHDTPSPGITAVLFQCSPCAHGQDLVNRNPGHSFLIPFFDADGKPSYNRVKPEIAFVEPFLGVQAAATTFLDDAIHDQVPRVMGFVKPVRDYDGDGTPDATDPDPNDPTKK